MKSFWKKWMVYFINSSGGREGCEHIEASSKEEAMRLYRMFFNVKNSEDVRAIPSVGEKTWPA